MKTQVKNNERLRNFALAAVTIIVLAVFCFWADLSLLIPLLLLFLGIHLFYFKKAHVKLFLQLGLLLTLIIFTAYVMTRYYGEISYLYIPISCVGMLTILLFGDLQLSFMMALLSSVLGGLIVGNDFHFMLISFVGSLTAIYSVKDARTRGKLIEAGFFVGLIQVVAFILLNPTSEFIFTRDFVLKYAKPLMLNGIICAIVVMVSSKIFEMLFGVLTNFSLLELSDFNQPLLKRLVLEAPGTYHHSLVVSNIAESAADAIGANALLTRVGAYYHDVGKMLKPVYFTENQMVDGSKHDNLEPSISRLVILNHVKDGVELAKKYKLSQHIIDFIPQHHGTSLIYYFYQRALEDAGQDETVEQENFRYAGPKPQSRETAIVLLADSVEGAVRALSEPTPNRIDEVVRKVINNKFIDGQLDECDLTLKNIEVIGATFTRVLSAMYHTRIKYPEKRNGNGNHNRKSSEANFSKPHSDDQDDQEDS